MRTVELFARSRSAFYAVPFLAVVNTIGWAAARLLLSLPYAEPATILIPVLGFLPLAAASIVAVGASSPFGDVELTIARSLSILRLVHLAGLLLIAALALHLAALFWDLSHAWAFLFRNLLGFAGLAFLAARFVGGRLSWAAPFAFLLTSGLTGRAEQAEPERYGIIAALTGAVPVGEWERWAWSFRPATDLTSWTIALALLVAGLSVFCLYGVREPAAEIE